MNWGAEPVVLAEIEQDYCQHTYGVAPCTAALGVTGANKCYNTFRTCQSAKNYRRVALTLRFAKPVMELPLTWEAIPSLVSIKTSPTRLNIGGSASNTGPLGQRATCTVTFQDHPDGDIKTDPYLASRDYDPFTRGTFWTKWMARNPYYKNRKMRIREGYIGQSPEEMITRHYVIDKITGPDSNGRVSISGVDVLRLADDDKAKAPPLSRGELLEDITETDQSLSVAGAAIDEYEATGGIIRIDSELIGYASIQVSGGVLVFNGLTRGVEGSEIKSHDAGDRVQHCLRYVERMVHDVVRELLVDYAQIQDEFIPFSEWDEEASVWLPQFTVSSVISEPTGINALLSELTQECRFYIWWDERAQRIKLRAIRPPVDTIKALNTDGHILVGSQSFKEDPNQRISRIWIFYQPRNRTKSLSDEANYRKVRVTIDAASESDNEYGESKVRKIFCRWIRTDAQAINLGARLMASYRDNPKYLTIRVDAKDRDTWTADIIDVTSELFVDETGLPLTRRFQVISSDEIRSGEVIQYELRTFEFLGNFAYWMRNDAPSYANATEVEKRLGMWWCKDNGKMPDADESDAYTWQ